MWGNQPNKRFRFYVCKSKINVINVQRVTIWNYSKNGENWNTVYESQVIEQYNAHDSHRYNAKDHKRCNFCTMCYIWSYNQNANMEWAHSITHTRGFGICYSIYSDNISLYAPRTIFLHVTIDCSVLPAYGDFNRIIDHGSAPFRGPVQLRPRLYKDYSDQHAAFMPM